MLHVTGLCLQTIGCGYWKDTTSTGFPKPYVCEHRWPEVAAMVRWRRAVYTAGKGFSGYQSRFEAGNKVMAASYAGKGFFMLNIGADAFRCGWLLQWLPDIHARRALLQYPGARLQQQGASEL